MKIKPMSIELAKEELALADLNATRSYLDEISYNIRDLFYGESTDPQEYKPVEIAENLIVALDIFTYTLDRLSHLERSKNDLPTVNSIVFSLRSIVGHCRLTASKLQSQISSHYYNLLADRIDILEEAIVDTERTFFVLPNHKGFVEAMNELLNLK